MAGHMRLVVPRQHYLGLEKLFNLSPEEAQALKEAAEHTPPTLWMEDYVAQVTTKVGHDIDIAVIFEVLSGLYRAAAELGRPMSDFVDEVTRALADTKRDELQPKDGDWSDIKARLLQFLTLDTTLGVASKVAHLRVQHENVFHGVQIFTDLRPVFEENAENTPVAGAIVHQMKIVFHTGGETQEVFIALDAHDLRKLRSVVRRAEQKEQSLSRLMRGSLQLLEASGDDA